MRSSTDKIKQWQAHFAAQKESGLSVQRYCDEHNIKKHQFTYYKNRFKNQATLELRPKLVPVVVTSPKTIKIKINGVPLEFEDSTPPRWMAELLQAMGS